MKKGFLSFVFSVISFMTFAQIQNVPQWTDILSGQPETFRTQLISSSEESIQVNVQVPGFYMSQVTTPRGEAFIISVPKSVSTAQAGEPNVPMTGIPVMIGDQARMSVRVVDAQYRDFENIEVAPSKGDFSRQIDPATVPYTYGECYSQDAFFPASTLDLYEPYIIRDFRGQNMAVYPFSYNPVTKTLRVYYNMTVEMYKVDDNGTNVMETNRSNTVKLDPDFKSVYQRHFINYEAGMSKYTPLDEEGDLLIICYDNFISAMTDFVNWKKTRGINTTIVGTSTAGSSYTAIKNYIQSQYNANNNITHVLLVGDVAQIPGYSYSGGGSNYSGLGDNAYGQIVGSDYYNDVFIGRFSASTAARVATQCNRVITYERDLTTSATWLQVAEGIAKKEGGSGHNGEDDYQHMDVIRTDLLNYGYSTVYQRYENLSGYTATASQISSDINNGVGIVNYCNHGAETMWGVASYSVSHVNALTNENKLPFIWSVACLVGKYDHSSDCFAEAWMNATNNNNPTGAIGTLMSYISQPWIPPMWAQDECIDILAGLSSSGGTKHTWGGLSINGLFGIFDNYGTDQSAVGTYQAWILYGDPSMMVRTKTPQNMTVNHVGNITLGASTYTVNVSNGNGSVATITDANYNILGKATVSNGTATINLNSSNLTPGSELTLCVFGFNKVTQLSTINVVGGTQYHITVTQPQHGTISAPAQAYANSTVTLTATPEAGYCLSSWTVKKGSTSIPVTNNQFTMPEGDVTVTATFVQGLQVTLASVMHGSISADPLYALQGMTINLTATPAQGYEFGSWVVNKTGDVNTTVTVNNNSFIMPNYPVTVSANFVLGPTDLTVYNGTATNQYIPMYGYYFDDYTKSEYIIPASRLTAMNGCTVSAITFYPSSVATTNSSWANTNQTVFLKEVSGTTLGGSFSGTSGATTVKQGLLEMPTAGTAYTITFDTPYTYNGGNLLIGIYNTAKGSYNKVEWYGTSNQTSGVSAYGNNSSNLNSVGYNAQSFIPKTTFTYMPASSDPVAITVSANPANGGTVTGAGTYDPGTTATLTATANEGYTFTNWTKNGVAVSTNASYSFTVNAANSGAYVANFTLNSYTITATAVPAEFGAVTVAGSRGNREDLVYDFEDGTQGWTVLKGNTGNSPNNWMHNTSYPTSNNNFTTGYGHNSSDGFMLSESYISGSSSGSGTAVTPDNYLVSPQVRLGGSISFYAGGRNTQYCAEKFSVMVSTTSNTNTASFTTVETMILSLDNAGYTSSPYTVDLSAYSGRGYIAIRHWDCYDQWFLCVDDITIVEGEDPSTGSGNFNYGETCTVTATPDEGYHFVNWTENGTEVSSEASYSFTVTGDRDLVANFQEGVEVTQTSELAAGLNWWTANVGVTLAELEAALGTNGLMISDNAGNFVTYTQFGWGSNPNFTELVPGRMYKIKTGANCSIDLTGVAINPSEVMITLNRGTNWIGFMGSTPVSVTDAFSGLAATVGDRISNGDGQYAKYSAYGWGGTLGALVPGEGYIYESKASGSITFTYSVSKSFDGKEGRDDTYHWTQPTPSLYSHRNHVTYQVRIDGVLQASNDIEVAAFIDEEVRGTVRLIEPYPGPLPDEYYTYLTVFGNAEDVGKYFTFKVYDHATSMEYDMCELSLVFRGEEEYEYGGLEMGYYIDFVTVPTWTLPIEAHTPDGGWYLITTPLAENTDAELVDNMISNDFDLYRFNQAVDLEWENWKNEESDHYHFNLEPGRGYLYANSGSVELTFRGEMYDGDCNVTIHNVGSGWNLIGNPYTVGASIGRGFYIMNPEGRAEIIPSEEDEIAPLEGVFVYTEEEEETVTFLIGNAKTTNTRERIVLNLSNDKGSIIDRVMVRMGESNTLPKYMLDESHTHISISRNGNDYAVVNGKDEEMFPVNFKAERTGTYTLTANVHDINVAYLHLIDNLTGADIDLLQTSSYTFNANTSDYASRFKLVFATDNDTDDSFAFISNGNIIVNGEGTLQVIDVQGRILISRRNDTHSISTSEMASGVYMLRLTNGSEIKTQKLIIR
jgi:gingipain R